MTAAVQRSIFDFKDRILPKETKTVTVTDWDGNEATIRTEDALAIVSAIDGKLTTGGLWPRFMVDSRWTPNGDRALSNEYISYWVHEIYHCKVDYNTGEIYDRTVMVKKPITKDGKYMDTGQREPVSARIEDGSLRIECTDGNTYAVRIDDEAPVRKCDIQRFDPVNGLEAKEHLMLHCFIHGARGDELLPLMTYGPCYLNKLDGRIEQDCQIQDLAKKYGIDLPMPVTVHAWSPEHYPNQEKCSNCSRRQGKGCQIVGAYKTPTSGTSYCHWHWDGTPFKKLSKKKAVTEDEDEKAFL